VRVIAATNANLLDRVRLGTFREDLFYRLCVIELVVPPLEDRRIDIAPMAERFALEAASRLGLPPRRLSLRASMALEAAEWPGHVRQLKNAVEAAAVRADADESAAIEAAHVFPTVSAGDQRADYHAMIRDTQRKVISDALAAHNWNVAEAANAIGLGRSSLYQLIKSLGLERT
jgi:DNA-binding NtrC family response regulator